jgi:hypothetical protein
VGVGSQQRKPSHSSSQKLPPLRNGGGGGGKIPLALRKLGDYLKAPGQQQKLVGEKRSTTKRESPGIIYYDDQSAIFQVQSQEDKNKKRRKSKRSKSDSDSDFQG